ncbi:MAG TPA: adenylate/guanylate cyclase domain-containing protein [Candidatus Dormibacteraeota bacterium]|nr:adenylate/guanylate cyclase domain-containing protein [Candidatus Dormibacteraeota bacterium]
MNLNPVLVVVLAVIGGLVVAAAIAGVTTILIIRAIRQRRAQKRAEEEARRRSQEGADLFGPSSVLALAAGIEGVRFATQVFTDVGRKGVAPALAGSLRKLADITESDRPSLSRVVADDGSVTLMFSDIEGSTELNRRLGDEAWLELLREHDAIVRRRVRKSRGQVVKTQGDSFMVAFKELEPALRCAIAIQRDLEDEELAPDPPIRVRIGLHHGEVTRQGRDVFGINVALAARVAAEAAGGEILVSSEVKRLADGEDVSFGRGRTVQLKGITNRATLYPVEWSQAE